MDQFIKLLPDGKSVTSLDDLLSLKVSELKKILFSYNMMVSGNVCSVCLRKNVTSSLASLLGLEPPFQNECESVLFQTFSTRLKML